MAPRFYFEIETIIHLGPTIAPDHGHFAVGGGHIETRQRGRGAGDRLGVGRHLAYQILEQCNLQRQGLVGGAGDAAFEISQFGGGIAGGRGHGLAVDERAFGTLRHFPHLGCCDLHEIAQNVVVPDFQRGNTRLFAITALQGGDKAFRFIAQGAQLVQFGGIARGNKAAVAHAQRQFRSQRAAQPFDEHAMATTGPGLGPGRKTGRQFRNSLRRFGSGFSKQTIEFPRRLQSLSDGRQIARATAP